MVETEDNATLNKIYNHNLGSFREIFYLCVIYQKTIFADFCKKRFRKMSNMYGTDAEETCHSYTYRMAWNFVAGANTSMFAY